MKQLLFLVFLVLIIEKNFSQEIVPFSVRKKETIKGGLKMIGNNTLNRDPANEPYHEDKTNDYLTMKYIDIDNQADTFCSSAATLSFSNASCSKIRYAGLYWGAFYLKDDPTKNTVKLKTPSQNNYTDLTADSYIFDFYSSTNSLTHISYVCYKDVTDLVSKGDPNGEYMVANVKATETTDLEKGASAGWVLVIIYEDPNQNAKHITTFDGYASVHSVRNGGANNDVTFTFSGFKTLPAPLPVNARLGVVALEGDKGISGDRLSIEKNDGSYLDLSTSVNPVDNFFNGSISDGDAIVSARRPNSENTLGWDIDLFPIPNQGNSIIKNDQTSAKFQAYTTQDRYEIFFSAFEVEIIEPKMNLVKTVEDAASNILNNSTLALGDRVYYGLEFQNVGNDNATSYQIKDFLPKNVTLDTSVPFEIPTGVTYQQSVTPSGETMLVFDIPDALVAKNIAKQKIRYAVKISGDCTDFLTICSEKISSKAYSVYKGELNQNQITDNGSFSSLDACKLGTPEDTIFYVDVSGCNTPTKLELLCGENLLLTAEAGYDNYLWRNQQGEIVGREQTIRIFSDGNYIVTKIKNGCATRTEYFSISQTQRQETNPINSPLSFYCSQTMKAYPQVFLCGTNATKVVDLQHITNLDKAEWLLYSGGNNFAIDENCPPEEIAAWRILHQGKTFTITSEGIYKLRLTFDNQCVTDYFFRVHTAFITPSVAVKNSYCNAQGEIEILGANSEYEYAAQLGNQPIVYSDNNIIKVSKSGSYTIFVRKKNSLPQGCVFRFDDVKVTHFEQQLRIKKVQNESCYNQNDGNITFEVFGGKLPYLATLTNLQSTENQSVTISTESITTSFSNLSPAQYSLKVSDAGGCENVYSFSVEKAKSLAFETKNELVCLENQSVSQIELLFEDPNLDLSKVFYSYENATPTLSFLKIHENSAFLYPNFPSGSYRINIQYENCKNSQLIDFQEFTALQIFQKIDINRISTLEIEAFGGSGNYLYRFNGKNQTSPVYYLKKSDNGYKNADNQEVKQIAVEVEDSLGCIASKTFEVLFYDIEIPLHFSPNGDGVDEVWSVKNAQGYPHIRVHIFDNSGRKITTLTQHDSWDGTYQGKPLPSGDYWFKLTFNEFSDRRVYIGHFSLIR